MHPCLFVSRALTLLLYKNWPDDIITAASRMMHDCGASHNYTVLLDMPLSLSPLNLLTGVPVVSFSPTTRSRFGVLPRHAPQEVQWFTAPSCVIFHTALTYDTRTAVHLLCCQLNSSTLVYAAGNLPIPRSQVLPVGIEETCRLHYYRFPLDPPPLAVPTHSFPLSVIPFEFPCVPFGRTMEQARFVYGCSMTSGSFSAALGTAAKIDCLVKVKVQVLIQKGIQQGNAGEKAVDDRSISDILATKTERLSAGEETDLVRVFEMPRGWYAQEATFIPRAEQRDEDDGFLVTYVFDEAQLDPLTGEATATACSELWVIDAWNMVDVVAKIALPQRGMSIADRGFALPADLYRTLSSLRPSWHLFHRRRHCQSARYSRDSQCKVISTY